MSGHVDSAHPFHEQRSFVKGALKPRIEPQIPCHLCFQPATSIDEGYLREARCPRGHVTLTDKDAMTRHTAWLASHGAYNGPSAQ